MATDITIKQEITIELDGKSPFEYVVMKQGDKGSRILVVTLLQNKQPYEIPDGCVARIKYYKPDGNPVLNDCTISGNEILVTYTEQMLAARGVGKGEIVLLQDGKELKSATYYTKIVETVYKTEGLTSDKEFLSMAKVLNEMDQATQKVTQTASIAENAAQEAKNIANALQQAKESGEFKGEPGEKGEQGPQGEKGADGAPGPQGATGKSAYEYAKDGGYTGTESEFAAKMAADTVSITYDADTKTLNISSVSGGVTASTVAEIAGEYDVEKIVLNGVELKLPGGNFAVNLDIDENDNVTADKTVSDIISAYKAGLSVTCVLDDGDVSYAIPLAEVGANEGMAVVLFKLVVDQDTIEVVGYQIQGGNDEWEADMSDLIARTQEAAIINGTYYYGDKRVDFTETINAMIDVKLGVVENGSY